LPVRRDCSNQDYKKCNDAFHNSCIMLNNFQISGPKACHTIKIGPKHTKITKFYNFVKCLMWQSL
jgi:hypothetical protein